MDRPPAVWMLILICTTLWGGEFVRRGLWEPDEARYAYVAREMRQTGNWFVPHINGELYPDKPPLLFWLINTSSLLTGGRINGVSARIPSLLGSILTLWAVARLTARWHSARAAWRSVAVLSTSYMFWHEGGWGRTDALLCGFVMMSVYFLIISNDGKSPRKELAGYLFCGLAALTKGPIGLLLPIGIYLCVLSADRDEPGPGAARLSRGVLTALCIPAAWLAAAWLSGAPGSYFVSMFTEKSFARIANSTGHSRPAFYYLWHFPLEFLPWTVALPAAFVTISYPALKRRLIAWFLFVIILFSLFTCKRNVYILAAYPAVAMMIGIAWDDFEHLSPRARTASVATMVALICLIGVGEAVASFVPTLPFDGRTLVLPAGIMISGGLLLIPTVRTAGLGNRWFSLLIAILFLQQVALSVLVYPAVNDLKAPLQFAEQTMKLTELTQPVYLFRHQMAIFPLYANRPGKCIRSYAELQRLVSTERNGVAVFTRDAWEAAPRFRAHAIDTHRTRVGHKEFVWMHFANTTEPLDAITETKHRVKRCFRL